MRRYKHSEQLPPETGEAIAPGVIMRLEHVHEVDPALMGTHFSQQLMPVWDSERIVDNRWEHLDWMHAHFADDLLVAGEPDELHQEPPGAQPELQSREERSEE